MSRLAHVEQISINVVLHDEARGIKPGHEDLVVSSAVVSDPRRVISPVVKDLTAHHMSSDTPAVIIPLVPEPVVSENLRVKIVRLVGGVVDVPFRSCRWS